MKKEIHARPLWFLGVFLTLGLILAACAPAATQTPAAAATTAPVPVTSGEATVNLVNDPKLGEILVGTNGRTVYAFTKDGPNQVNCAGTCAQNWPVLKSMGHPQAGTGVDASLLGTTTMSDGSIVVTYNKLPLHYFIKDTKAGDVNGQGVAGFWFTVSPDGKLVGHSAASGQGTGAAAEVTINLATDPNLGKILVDGKGMTLYMFTKDTPDTSKCSGTCAKIWPPLYTLGSPQAGSGVDASLLGSITLADGTKMVTYNHMPLYYFIQDKAAGDVKGQNSGTVWFVVSPDGKQVVNSPSQKSGYSY